MVLTEHKWFYFFMHQQHQFFPSPLGIRVIFCSRPLSSLPENQLSNFIIQHLPNCQIELWLSNMRDNCCFFPSYTLYSFRIRSSHVALWCTAKVHWIWQVSQLVFYIWSLIVVKGINLQCAWCQNCKCIFFSSKTWEVSFSRRKKRIGLYI